MNTLRPSSLLHRTLLLCAWLLILPSAGGALAAERVTIQLKWLHQFQFAGYYAALDQGFYAEEGLEVTLLESDPAMDNIQRVLDGHAHYGVADDGILLAHHAGKPLRIVAQPFQRSPLVLLTLADAALRTPADLRGKRVMTNPAGANDAPLRAMLLKGLGELSAVELVAHSYRNRDLLEGRVDAMLAYLTNEPYWFEERGVAVNVIDPRAYGIDFYGDNLFTTETEIREHPARVAKLVRATLKGWRYALENRAVVVELIQRRYNSQERSRAHLMFEAERVASMINSDSVALGHFDVARYQRIAEEYARLGIVDRFRVDEGYYYRSPPIAD